MHQYASWRISLNGVSDPRFFGNVHQHWNAEHKLAKKIFGHGLPSEVLLHGIHKAHHVLYHKGTADVHGNLIWAGDLLDIFKAGTIDNRLRPVLYTYVIDDSDMWKFSETGAALSVNVVSKHILHSAASPTIRYSGEFHWRPVVDGYWSGLHGTNALEDASTQWELVIDNNSGTYAPDKRLLPNLKALLEFNFPGLRVVALEHEDPALKLSKEALAKYARRQ
ncbi:hypothetical protein FRB98_006787 [Tulasnella sp. 332]|nr:hypothetical protein FRB98_006787 [Tulasnella sp. 332]